MYSRTSLRCALHGYHFVRTPFDHQMLNVPRYVIPLQHALALSPATADDGSDVAIAAAATVSTDTAMAGGTASAAQCAQLATLCNVYKEQLVEAESVSRYYRARYKSGAQQRRRKAERWASMTDSELHHWACACCVPVHDPLCPL